MIDVYLGAVPRVPRVVAGHTSQHLLTPRAHCQGPARVSLTCDDVMYGDMSRCYQEPSVLLPTVQGPSAPS